MKLKLRAGLRQPRAKRIPLLLQRLLMKKSPARSPLKRLLPLEIIMEMRSPDRKSVV